MSSHPLLARLFAVSLVGALALPASAATVAQYTFEENAAGTSSSASGTVLEDSSGNDLDFTKTSAFGTLAWTSDVASVQPAGSTSLRTNAIGVDSVVSDRYSFAKTGQLTVETWYKPNIDNTFSPILSFSGGNANGWSLYQEFPSAGNFNLEFSYRDNAAGLHSVNTATTFDINSGWNHIAVTIDTATSDLSIYINGTEDTATVGTGDLIGTFGTITDVMDLNQFSDGSFTGNLFLDDLRISDTALSAGTGTGDGELAWNATLIPEPASLALLGIGGVMVVGRGRRAAG